MLFRVSASVGCREKGHSGTHGDPDGHAGADSYTCPDCYAGAYSHADADAGAGGRLPRHRVDTW